MSHIRTLFARTKPRIATGYRAEQMATRRQIAPDGRTRHKIPGAQQITDPSVAAIISANGLNRNFTNNAITDAKGNLLLVNPARDRMHSGPSRSLRGGNGSVGLHIPCPPPT